MAKRTINWVIVRFIGTFFLLVLAFSAVVLLPWTEEHIVLPYTAFLARFSGWILGLVGTSVQVQGTTITHNTFAIEIQHGCDGLDATILLVAALLAFPATWRNRANGVLWGFGVICVLNMSRIIGLCLLGFHGFQQSFEFFHLYAAQFGVIVFTMVFWISWAARQKAVVT